MPINRTRYESLSSELKARNILLVAVSKIQPAEAILELYHMGQRDFGENYVQELVDKQAALPADIRWHFIGHLQTNKVRYIAPFVHLIHGIDSLRLLKEVNKEASKNGRIIDVLLQVHIAAEETKFGWDREELQLLLSDEKFPEAFPNVRICGLMGMASFTEDAGKLRSEFASLQSLYDQLSARFPSFSTLSMGMSGDYTLALEAGSNLVRIGSLIFGARG